MRNIHNQKGYALLIVMLTVIIFLSLSSIVFTSTLNNAKQEQTVNISNQSVVAAEMGIQQISSDLKNQIKVIEDRIRSEYPNFDDCKAKNNCFCNMVNLDTSIKDKNVIVGNLNICYVSKIDQLINSTNEKYLVDQVILNDPPKIFYNLTLPIKRTVNGDWNSMLFEVEGTNLIPDSAIEKSSTLRAEMKVGKISLGMISTGVESITNVNQALDTTKIFRNLPTKKCKNLTRLEVNNSVDRIECLVEKGEKYSSLVNNWNSNSYNKNKIKLYFEDYVSVCKNNCNNPDIDMTSETVLYFESLYLENTNNRSPFKAIVNGNYNMYQANGFGNSTGDTFILAKSFSANSLSINRSVIIISGEDSGKTTQFDISSLSISSNSKVCLNIDNFDTTSINNIYTKINGTGKLIILKTNQAINNFDVNKIVGISNISVVSNPQNFAADCGLQEVGFKEVFILDGKFNQATVTNVYY